MKFIGKVTRVFKYVITFSLAYVCATFIKLTDPSMRNVWIVSERGDDARDNGYFFFNYLLREHPEINAYYIIKSTSADAMKIDADKIVELNSFKHFVFFALCRVRISSHAWGGDVPAADYYRKLRLFSASKKVTVFLQHGITKDYQPGLCYPHIKPSLFICGAKPEYEYVCKSFNHPDDVVQYTGFARFDTLDRSEIKNQILIMPTFRKWLQGNTNQGFTDSEYYKRWQELLDQTRIIEVVEKNHIDLVFYPHYEIQKYVHLFHSPSNNIKIADFENYDVQTLLKESKLLITDYSSVFFDFSYMRKPILFYQFDRERYIKDHYDFTKGYFNYDTMAPGKVVFNKDVLVYKIKQCIETDFIVDKEYLSRISSFFPVSDHNNCKRIYESIQRFSI